MAGRWGAEHRGVRNARRSQDTKGANVRELITLVITQQVPPLTLWGGGRKATVRRIEMEGAECESFLKKKN